MHFCLKKHECCSMQRCVSTSPQGGIIFFKVKEEEQGGVGRQGGGWELLTPGRSGFSGWMMLKHMPKVPGARK